MTASRLILALAALLALSACGADGEPTPPTEPGVTLSGQVKVGVVGGV